MAAGRQSLILTSGMAGGRRLARLLACDDRETSGVRPGWTTGAAASGTGATADTSRTVPPRGCRVGSGSRWLGGDAAACPVRVTEAPAGLPARMLPSGARKRVVSESCRVGSHPAKRGGRRLAKTNARKAKLSRLWCGPRAVRWPSWPLITEPAGGAVVGVITRTKFDTDNLGRGQTQTTSPRRTSTRRSSRAVPPPFTGRRRGSRCCRANRRR